MKRIPVDYMSLVDLSAFYPFGENAARELNDKVDPNNDKLVKDAIRRFIAPRLKQVFEARPADAVHFKESLRYYLTTTNFPIDEVYHIGYPAFELPDQPLNYYRWAWEVFYPEEDYHVSDLSQYEELTRPSALRNPADRTWWQKVKSFW